MKRAAIFQGGGRNGAFSAGMIAGIIDNRGYTWDEYYGTSVGALVALMASTGDTELLRKAFTTMGNKDVWSKNPLNKKGNISISKALWRMSTKHGALGETKNLRKNLAKLYTERMFNDSDKSIIACSVNYSDGTIAYGRNDTLSYNLFLDAVHASTSVPMLCPPIKIFGNEYQDGGLLMNTPIQQAINNGCDEIDVFMLTPKPSGDNTAEIIAIDDKPNEWKGKNILDYAGRSISLMREHIADYNLLVASMMASDKDVTIRFRYPEHPLSDKPLEVMNFNKKEMAEMYELGYHSISKSIKVVKKANQNI